MTRRREVDRHAIEAGFGEKAGGQNQPDTRHFLSSSRVDSEFAPVSPARAEHKTVEQIVRAEVVGELAGPGDKTKIFPSWNGSADQR
jgi:hypothetical protein